MGVRIHEATDAHLVRFCLKNGTLGRRSRTLNRARAELMRRGVLEPTPRAKPLADTMAQPGTILGRLL